jgi:hypothetical protein
MSSNKEFQWNDDLVIEFARFTNHEAPTMQGRYSDIEQFKQSKIKEKEQVVRPPLGIMPEWRWKELRAQELNDAIKRYCQEDKEIPQEWLDEQEGIQKWLQIRNKNKPTPPPKPDRIEVKGLETYMKNRHHYLNMVIPHDYTPNDEKLIAIKYAVEAVLNNDEEIFYGNEHQKTAWETVLEYMNILGFDKYNDKQATSPLNNMISFITKKLYTQSEVELERKESFEAGRDRTGGFWNDQIKNWTYPTFQDYLSSINSIKK